ncbi:MAG: hypothetical protein V4643_06840 [Bacteroidota bacterium]
MRKLAIAILFISFLACKKEDNTTTSQTTADSVIYYNKWTKLNKTNYEDVGLFTAGNIADLSMTAEKGIVILTYNNITILDRNFNLVSTQTFTTPLNDIFKLSKIFEADTLRRQFYYWTYLQTGGAPKTEVLLKNYVSNNSVQTTIYGKSVFISDTSGNIYNIFGHDYDYYAYHISLAKEKRYLLNYHDEQKNINKSVEFSSRAYLPRVFRINNKVVFLSISENFYTSVDLKTFNTIEDSYPINYFLIGSYNGNAYFNHSDKGIYKSSDLITFTKVFQNNSLGVTFPFFGDRYLLYEDYSNGGFILFDLKTDQAKSIKWDFLKDDEMPRHYWVNGNILYVLTNGNIYAKKF